MPHYTLGQQQLVRMIGRPENAISRALQKLEQRNWLSREKVGKQYHLTFAPPTRYLHQMLCFCSKAAPYSLPHENKKEELLKINRTLKAERDALREKFEGQLARQQRNKELASQVTDEQLGSFIDDFLQKASDVFDNRSLKAKLVASILTFQVKLGLREQTEPLKETTQQKDPLPHFGSWNSSKVAEGFNLQKQLKKE